MKKKTDLFLVQVTYMSDKYEYGLFYILHKSQIGYINKKLFIMDGDVEFVDGEDGVTLHIYDDYKVTIEGHSQRNLEVKIEANRHRFYAYKHLSVMNKERASYDYYYRKKREVD